MEQDQNPEISIPQGLAELFEAAEPQFAAVLGMIESHREDLLAISGLEAPQPRFEQDWFPRLDAAAHYALIRHYRPRHLIEIGAGHSTRFAVRATVDGSIGCAIASVDPEPRSDISALPVLIMPERLQDVPPSLFDRLRAGDMLTVDSSHIFEPGSDVDLIIDQILPELPAGVIIFFHDMFLPEPYPERWPFSQYNEQYALAPLLGEGYDLLFSSSYAMQNMPDQVMQTVISQLPLAEGAVENGLWLKKSKT